MSEVSAASWWEMTPEEVRKSINQRIMEIESPIPFVHSIIDQVVHVDSRITPLRIYIPNEGEQFPLILFIHGGAWVAGSLDTHDNLARYLSSQTQAVVVSVGYLNSPEGKFPLPLEQSYDALMWTIANSKKYCIDPSRIALVGDSSGGNMTAALSLVLRDRRGPRIDLQVLINPSLDLSCGGSLERQGDALDVLRYQALQYLSDPSECTLPYASPLLAQDLRDLPSALVILAEKDDLYQTGLNYAERLRAANVPTQIYCQKGVDHLAGEGARASLKARESLDIAIIAIKNAFKEWKVP